MFAIIQSGAKQYKVENGAKVSLEKLPLDAGAEVIFDNVVLFNDGKNTKVGSPFIDGCSVKASVLANQKNKKVIVFKKRRRKNSRRKTGHRQCVTVVEIKEIRG